MYLGEILSILSALTWAFGVILYRQLGTQLSPLRLNYLKNALVLLMLIPAVPLVHGWAIPSLNAEQWILALASGALGIAVADTMYFRALTELGAARMGVIGNFYSPFVIALSFLFLDERLNLTQFVGFALVSLGVLMVGSPDGSTSDRSRVGKGVLLGVLAIFLMAAAIVMIKRVLEDLPLLWVTAIRMIGALLGLAVLVRWRGRSILPWRGVHMPGLWPRLILAAFVGQFLSMIFWLGGYKYTLASVAAILNETASIFILLFAAWLLRERLNLRSIIGVSLSFAGVACMLIASQA